MDYVVCSMYDVLRNQSARRRAGVSVSYIVRRTSYDYVLLSCSATMTGNFTNLYMMIRSWTLVDPVSIHRSVLNCPELVLQALTSWLDKLIVGTEYRYIIKIDRHGVDLFSRSSLEWELFLILARRVKFVLMHSLNSLQKHSTLRVK